MNDRFENDLKHALRRVEAPAGFTDRVLTAAGQTPVRTKQPFARRWLAMAASITVIGGLSVWGIAEQRKQAEVERTRAEFALAAQITVRQMEKIEKRIRSIGMERIVIEDMNLQ